MASVILDSSVTIAWLLPDEPWHQEAVALHRDVVAGEIDPVVAAHHGFEVRHALVRAVHRARCAWPAIPGYLAAIHRMQFEVNPVEEADATALGLCQDLRLTWGDSLWVALAVRLALPLVTADLRLVRSVPPGVAWIVPLSDHPI